MSAGKGRRANERGAAPEAVLGTRPGGRRGGCSYGRWACGGAEGARGTAGRGWRDCRRDWPSTLSRGGVSAGAARACELERGASEEPGSPRPPQVWGGLAWPPGGSRGPCGHIWGCLDPAGYVSGAGARPQRPPHTGGATAGAQRRLGRAPGAPLDG